MYSGHTVTIGGIPLAIMTTLPGVLDAAGAVHVALKDPLHSKPSNGTPNLWATASSTAHATSPSMQRGALQHCHCIRRHSAGCSHRPMLVTRGPENVVSAPQ